MLFLVKLLNTMNDSKCYRESPMSLSQPFTPFFLCCNAHLDTRGQWPFKVYTFKKNPHSAGEVTEEPQTV